MRVFPKGLLWVLTAVIGGAVGAGIVMLRSESKTSWSYAAEGREAQAAREMLARADYKGDELTTAFRTVAKAMRPSVVSVSTVKHVPPASWSEATRVPVRRCRNSSASSLVTIYPSIGSISCPTCRRTLTSRAWARA